MEPDVYSIRKASVISEAPLSNTDKKNASKIMSTVATKMTTDKNLGDKGVNTVMSGMDSQSRAVANKVINKAKQNGKPIQKVNDLVSAVNDEVNDKPGNPNQTQMNEMSIHDTKWFDNYTDAAKYAKKDSMNGYVQWVEKSNGGYRVSDWYDYEVTVAGFENGRHLEGDDVELDENMFAISEKVDMYGKLIPNKHPTSYKSPKQSKVEVPEIKEETTVKKAKSGSKETSAANMAATIKKERGNNTLNSVNGTVKKKD
jgi:hypothetical protein